MKIIRIAPIVGLVGLLTGCGGDASISGLTDAATNFAQGQASLDTALQLPQSGDPVPGLAQAVYKLNTSYSQQPTPVRGVAYAVAATAKVSAEIAKLFGTTITREATGVRKFSSDLTIWNTGTSSYASKMSPKSWLTGLWGDKSTSRAYPDDPTPAQLRGALGAVETDLKRVCDVLTDTNIAALDANPLVMDDPTQADPTKKVRVGASEAYQIRAMSKAMLGFINFIQAYEYGYPSSYNYEQSLESAFGTLPSTGAAISGSDLLPTAPFGSLRADGAARLLAMITDWTTSSSDLILASNSFVNRTRSGSGETPWLSELTSFDRLDQTQLRADAADFDEALRGPKLIDGTTVNLSAFVSSAPSLSSLLPSFNLTKEGSNWNFSAVAQSNTFGGLFPNGVSFDSLTLDSSKSRLDLLTDVLASINTTTIF